MSRQLAVRAVAPTVDLHLSAPTVGITSLPLIGATASTTLNAVEEEKMVSCKGQNFVPIFKGSGCYVRREVWLRCVW